MEQYKIIKKSEIVKHKEDVIKEEYWIIKERFAWFFWSTLLYDVRGCFGYMLKFECFDEAKEYIAKLKSLEVT